MRTKLKISLGIAAIALFAIAFAAKSFRSNQNLHKHAKQRGLTSFDVYSDATATHIFELESGANETQALRYHREVDGARVYSIDLPIAPGERIVSRRSNDVQIAADGLDILVAWQVAGTGYMNRGPMRFALSTDAGKTWRSIRSPAAGTNGDQGFMDLAVDRLHRFHAVWLDVDQKKKGLRYALFDGDAWRGVETVSAVTCECCWNTLRLDARGYPAVLYRASAPRDMAYALRTPTHWQQSENVDRFSWQINACPHAGGSLAFGANSIFAITWTGETLAQGVYLQSKTNGSTTWARAKKFGGKAAKNPDIAIVQNRVAVVWDEHLGTGRAIWGATSNDAGKTWSEPRQVSAPGTIASYPRLAVEGDRFRVYWTESMQDYLTRRSTRL